MLAKKLKASADLPQGIKLALTRKGRSISKAIIRYALSAGRDYPWRDVGRSPYEILVAELTLKRTTAKAAARVYSDFLNKFPTLEHLHKASRDEIASVLAPIGLQWQRSGAIKRLAEHLIEKEDGNVPNDLDRLLSVPGVGHYSARAVLSFAYNIPSAVVDSNVERIIKRVFQESMPHRPTPAVFQGIADKLLPKSHHREFNFGMLDLGALICRPTAPRHDQCPLSPVCDYFQASQKWLEAENSQRPFPPLERASPLRKARKSKGLSLVMLAARAKVSKMTIVKIESGQTTPRAETLSKLASALGVSVEELKN